MKTREWLILETLNVVNRVLKNAHQITVRANMNRPTVKEMNKHPKLLRKQRARFGGV